MITHGCDGINRQKKVTKCLNIYSMALVFFPDTNCIINLCFDCPILFDDKFNLHHEI